MTLNDLYDLLLPPSTPLWSESIDAQAPGLILKLAVTDATGDGQRLGVQVYGLPVLA